MSKIENQFTITPGRDLIFPELIIKNNTTGEFVSIIPGSGARVKELWLNNGKENVSILKKIEKKIKSLIKEIGFYKTVLMTRIFINKIQEIKI